MTQLFMELVKLSISGSLFVLAVAALRLIFRKAPRWMFCLLWGLVALRLAVPLNIETRLSAVPPAVSRGQAVEQVMEDYLGEVEIRREGSEQYQAAIDAGRVPVPAPEGSFVITEKGSLEEPATLGDILAWVWLGGLCLMLGYTAVSWLLLKRRVGTATVLRENVRESEQVDSPFVLGLFRPVIYLPYRLDPADRENVIAHERAHIRRGDHWWKPLGFLLLSVYWFNPVLWLAYVLLCRDIEGACDEKVIGNMTKDQVRAYSRALLNCSVHRRRIAACPLAFGEVGVKQRIKSVMHYKKPAFWIILAAVLASAVAAVLLLTNPVEEIPEETAQPTETTQASAVPDKSEEILSLFEEIFSSPSVRSDADVYEFLRIESTLYGQLKEYGDEAVTVLAEQLRNTAEEGRREMLMAAVCADISGCGDKAGMGYWNTPKQWLDYYDRAILGKGEVPERDDKAWVLSLMDQILYNPQAGRTSDIYDYFRAEKEAFKALSAEGETTVGVLVDYLMNAEQYALRETLMAALCADITGIGGMRGTGNWTSPEQWLQLYFADGLKEKIGSSFDWDTGLLGAEQVTAQIINVYADPNQPGKTIYSYRFRTPEKDLVTVEDIRFIKTEDFDRDGVVELFAVIRGDANPYRLYDLENGKIQYTEPELVPDEVLDYQMLIEEEDLLLFQERWTWFFRDPVTYLQEVAKRGSNSVYGGIPSGNPYFLDDKTLREGYTQIHRYLDTGPGPLETEAAYRILAELDFRIDPETAVMLSGNTNEGFDYDRLFGKWSLFREGSEEKRNCLEQLLVLFDREPVALMKAMAKSDWRAFSGGYDSIVSWLIQKEFTYDAKALDKTLDRMEREASTEDEKTVAAAFRGAYEAQTAPSMDADYLLGGDGKRLWEAFFWDTEGVVRALGKLDLKTLDKVGQLLWESPETADRKNMEKCYEEVNRVLNLNLTEAEKKAAYELLIHLELEGGFKDTLVPGEPFDYERFFDKRTYTDGATSEYWSIQSKPIFRQDPRGYLEALADWDGADLYKDSILLSVSYDFDMEGKWLEKTLDDLLNSSPTPEVRDLVLRLRTEYEKRLT